MKNTVGRTSLGLVAMLALISCDAAPPSEPVQRTLRMPPLAAMNVVHDHAPVFRDSHIYDIVDEAGNTIWQDLATTTATEGSFRLFTFDPSRGWVQCILRQSDTVKVPYCEPVFSSSVSADRTCIADFTYPLTAGYWLGDNPPRLRYAPECFSAQVRPASYPAGWATRIRVVAAPTAPGGLVFKRWEVRFGIPAWTGDVVPCEEGPGSLTCTVEAEGYPSFLLVYGEPGRAFDFSGFRAPVDGAPTVNVARAGSAIPVKFSLGGDFGLDVLAAGSPSSQQVPCDLSQASSTVEGTDAAGNSAFSYDPATDEYSYTWKTVRSWAGSCRDLTLTLSNGESYSAQFRFRP